MSSASSGVKASLVMKAAMSSMRERDSRAAAEKDKEREKDKEGEKDKPGPAPFALPPAVLEQMREEAGITGESESSASSLAHYLARGHQNYQQYQNPAPKKEKAAAAGGAPAVTVSRESIALEATAKERSLLSMINEENTGLPLACLYCGVDTSLQLQLIKLFLQRRRFLEAGRALATFLLKHHSAEATADANVKQGGPTSDKEEKHKEVLSGFLGAEQGSAVADTADTAAATSSLPFGADAARLTDERRTTSEQREQQHRTLNPDFRLGGQISLSDILHLSSSSSSSSSSSLSIAGSGDDDGVSSSRAGSHGKGGLVSAASILPSWSVPLSFAPAGDGFPFYDEKASALIEGDEASAASAASAVPKRVFPVNSMKSLLAMKERIEDERKKMADDTASSSSSTSPLPLFLVGVDAEWRPTGTAATGSNASHNWPASLLQIATPASVFLVDLLALHHLAAREGHGDGHGDGGAAVVALVDDVIGDLFRSPSIPKVGFNLNGDVRKLSHTHPRFAASFERCHCVFELSRVLQAVADEWAKTIMRSREKKEETQSTNAASVSSHPRSSAAEPLPAVVVEQGAAESASPLAPLWLLHLAPAPASSSASSRPHHQHFQHASLSLVTEQVLGFSLNKRQQTSDWQARPFTVDQLVYASLDALVLVEVVKEAVKALRHSLTREALSALLMSAAQDLTASAASVEVDHPPPHHHALDYRPTLRQGCSGTLLQPVSSPPAVSNKPVAVAEGEKKEDEEVEVEGKATAGGLPLLGPSAVRQFLIDEKRKLSKGGDEGGDVNEDNDDVDFMLIPAPPSTTAEDGADSLGIPPQIVVKTLSLFATITAVAHNAGKTRRGAGASTGSASPVNIPLIALVRGDKKLDHKAVAGAIIQSGLAASAFAAAAPAASDSSTGDSASAPPSETKGSIIKQFQCKVRLATLDECKAVFGFVPGSFPPCGHRQAFPTLIDAGIPSVLLDVAHTPSPQSTEHNKDADAVAGPPLHHPKSGEGLLYGGGGSPAMKLRLTWKQLLRYCLVGGGCVAEIVSASSAANATATGTAASMLESLSLSDAAKGPSSLQPSASSSSSCSPPLLSLAALLKPYELAPLAFIVDGMLGRLTRWLRVIGIDAESTVGPGAIEFLNGTKGSGSSSTVPPPGVSKALYATRVMSIAEMISWARETGRILVTRDRKVLQAKVQPCAVYWVLSHDTQEAFEELTEHFAIRVKADSLMSRCARCNSFGYDRVGSAEAAVLDPTIPAKVLAVVEDFWRCRGKGCGRLYWEGAKFADTRGAFLALFEGSVIQPSTTEADGDGGQEEGERGAEKA